jgi:hypothetical protein
MLPFAVAATMAPTIRLMLADTVGRAEQKGLSRDEGRAEDNHVGSGADGNDGRLRKLIAGFG